MYTKKFIISLLISLSALYSCAQQDSRELAEKNFAEKYSNATEVEWSTDDHGNYEAQFKDGKRELRADYDRSGKWLETEESVKMEDLPEAVKKTIEDDYDKDEIAEIEWVDHHKKGIFYDVEFKDEGKNDDVEIDESGKVIKD